MEKTSMTKQKLQSKSTNWDKIIAYDKFHLEKNAFLSNNFFRLNSSWPEILKRFKLFCFFAQFLCEL